MPTKSQIISDIELRLTRGKPSDDLELSRSQIAFWMDSNRDAFVQDNLNKRLRRGDNMINPFYLIKETCKVVIEEDFNCNDCENRYYVTIDNDVLSLYRDKGIHRIEDTRGAILKGFSKEDIEMLYNLEFSTPTKKNQVYYRENKNLYIEKINDNIAELVKYHVWYIPANYADSIAENEDYPIDGDDLPLFLDYIEDIGRRQVYGEFEDLDNDGQQE